MTSGPGQRAHSVLAYIAGHPGCSKAEARRGAGASYEAVEQAIRAGHVGEDPGHPPAERQLHLTGTGLQAVRTAQQDGTSRDTAGQGTAHARRPPPSARARPGPGLTRALAGLASTLLRACGQFTIGGRTYLVVIPDDGRPPGTVYLRRDDGELFAVRPQVRVRAAAPGEAGIEAGP